MAAERELALQVERAHRQRGVVAALGLERNVLAERAREPMRPRAGGDDHVARDERGSVAQMHRDAVGTGRERDRIGAPDAAAEPLELDAPALRSTAAGR